MNLANKLTISRIAATGVFLLFLFADYLPFSKTAAMLVFIAACITDWVDGKIARMYQVESEFGKLMDPLADKILISSAFIAFIEQPQIMLPSWVVIIIIGREFLITGLRLLAANKGKIISAGFWGKNKTISQLVAIITILCYLSLHEIAYFIPPLALPELCFTILRYLITGIMTITVLLTIISGIVYMYQNWNLVKDI